MASVQLRSSHSHNPEQLSRALLMQPVLRLLAQHSVLGGAVRAQRVCRAIVKRQALQSAGGLCLQEVLVETLPH